MKDLESKEKEIKRNIEEFYASMLLKQVNVPPSSSRPFCNDFGVSIDNAFVVESLLKELIHHEQKIKHEFDVSNNDNWINNKNAHAQIPSGNSKQNKNRLANFIRCIIGSGRYESERAMHAISNLEKIMQMDLKHAQ